jgi:hypothetical protein
MITLISTPEYVDPLDPSVICRWVATESPNNFRLQRRDYVLAGYSNVGGYLAFNPAPAYSGIVGNSVTVVDTAGNTYVGLITNTGIPAAIVTDILYASLAAAASYVNDNTTYADYYFEGRLTINGYLYALTIMASPDTEGFADLDVSGILRIATSLGKVANYTQRIDKEYNKSGRFNFEYRGAWIGSSESWEGVAIVSPATSPPILIDWYYAECVRSEEQGSNLHDYVADSLNDAPFLNLFDQPVYFRGLPFDISFILPEQAIVTPASDITVLIKVYDSNNLLLSTITELIDADSLEGYVCSLLIDPATIPAGAAFLTAEITV